MEDALKQKQESRVAIGEATFRKSITNDEVVHIPAGFYHFIGGKLPTQLKREMRSFIHGRAAELITEGLLLVMALNLLSVIALKSITIDETSAIPSGYYYPTNHAFDLSSNIFLNRAY